MHYDEEIVNILLEIDHLELLGTLFLSSASLILDVQCRRGRFAVSLLVGTDSNDQFLLSVDTAGVDRDGWRAHGELHGRMLAQSRRLSPAHHFPWRRRNDRMLQ